MNDDGRRARRKENCSLCFRVSKGEPLPGQLRSCDVLPTIETSKYKYMALWAALALA
jgi:hypothetical protein